MYLSTAIHNFKWINITHAYLFNLISNIYNFLMFKQSFRSKYKNNWLAGKGLEVKSQMGDTDTLPFKFTNPRNFQSHIPYDTIWYLYSAILIGDPTS